MYVGVHPVKSEGCTANPPPVAAPPPSIMLLSDPTNGVTIVERHL